MKIIFCRQYPIEARVNQNPRAFQFHVGVTAPLDPQSGMTVNMMDLDRSVGEVVSTLSQNSFQDESELMGYLHTNIEPKIKDLNAHICQISLQTSVSTIWSRDLSNS